MEMLKTLNRYHGNVARTSTFSAWRGDDFWVTKVQAADCLLSN